MKIILTEQQYKKIIEDVGDKYLQKKYGIKPQEIGANRFLKRGDPKRDMDFVKLPNYNYKPNWKQFITR